MYAYPCIHHRYAYIKYVVRKVITSNYMKHPKSEELEAHFETWYPKLDTMNDA